MKDEEYFDASRIITPLLRLQSKAAKVGRFELSKLTDISYLDLLKLDLNEINKYAEQLFKAVDELQKAIEDADTINLLR